jgi:hypothetical protein
MMRNKKHLFLIIGVLVAAIFFSWNKEVLGTCRDGICDPEETTQSCPWDCIEKPDDYEQYFLGNHNVWDAFVTYFEVNALEYFWQYIEELETTNLINIEKPAALAQCVAPAECYTIYLTDDEFYRIFAAKIAHSIWLDKNKLVPWRLADFSQEQLESFFRRERLFNFMYGSRGNFYAVVDYSPSDAYGYARKFIQEDMTQTAYQIINDLRKDFIHGISPKDPTTTSYSLYEALTSYNPSNQRISRAGCQSMSPIVSSLLKGINIPAYQDSGWYGSGHACAIMDGINKILIHGDDIYTGALKVTPNDELLMTDDYFNSNVKPCGKNTQCATYQAKRFNALNAIKYVSYETKFYFCNPTLYTCADHPCLDGEEYLQYLYGSFLTSEEIEQANQRIQGLCSDTTAPHGTISINNNSSYTDSSEVVLTLSVEDEQSGMGAGAQMQFSNDGDNWSFPEPYSTIKKWKLSEGVGEKTVYGKFKDAAHNWSGVISDSIMRTGPPTPPTIPTNLTATFVPSNQIKLTWTASTDNVGVEGYNIYRDGKRLGYSTTNSFSDKNLTPNTTYTYQVDAYDADGNLSAPSNTASATTKSDTTPPTIDGPYYSSGCSAYNPVNGAHFCNDVVIWWNHSDNSGGSGIDTDSVQVGYTDPNGNYTNLTPGATITQSNGQVTFPASSLNVDGPYTIKISVSDVAGNPKTVEATAHIQRADICKPTIGSPYYYITSCLVSYAVPVNNAYFDKDVTIYWRHSDYSGGVCCFDSGIDANTGSFEYTDPNGNSTNLTPSATITESGGQVIFPVSRLVDGKYTIKIGVCDKKLNCAEVTATVYIKKAF